MWERLIFFFASWDSKDSPPGWYHRGGVAPIVPQFWDVSFSSDPHTLLCKSHRNKTTTRQLQMYLCCLCAAGNSWGIFQFHIWDSVQTSGEKTLESAQSYHPPSFPHTDMHPSLRQPEIVLFICCCIVIWLVHKLLRSAPMSLKASVSSAPGEHKTNVSGCSDVTRGQM